LTVEDLSITSVAPAQVLAGHRAAVILTGTGFEPGATIMASNPAVTFSSVKVKGPTTISAKETVTASAAAGLHDLIVGVPGATATCEQCLDVGVPKPMRSARG
jgi:hypothetical protein